MIFYDGTSNSLAGIRDTLHDFSVWSGLVVNSDKTILYVAGIDDQEMRASLHCGYTQGVLPVRYLGLPLMDRRLKVAEYEPLVDAVARKFRGWSVKSLSFAGRAQLISTVIAGIVAFWSSAFLIPKSCLRKLDSLCAHYLWFGDPDKAGGARIAWKTVCLPRREGGLGLRSFVDWNRVLCLRLVWSLFEERITLWAAYHKRKHLRIKSFWQMEENQSLSWSWKSLLRLRPLARRFVKCTVGNGEEISFWFDSWTPFGPLIEFIGTQGPRVFGLPLVAKVADACSSHGWMLPSPRTEREVNLQAFLSTIALPSAQATIDSFSWMANGVNMTKFSSKRTWEDLRPRESEKTWAKAVWFKGAIPAHAFHCWVAQWNRLPTRARIRSWTGNENLSSSCVLCSQAEETRDHIFFLCDFASELWEKVRLRIHQSTMQTSRWDEMIRWLSSSQNREAAVLARLTAQAVLYHTWKERNLRLHNGGRRGAQVVFGMIDKDVRNAISGRRKRKRWRRLLELWFTS